ncbi:hypothetical protein ACFQMA_13950 [Halosimplex aquaticum]|uniref:Uncharacterized protein n=1 Tax=Halosimplex aquaticum TaxID=3026162 RepID=A0ABD5Y4W2_9EURY|nr:hypothetical protein [Halosimplex aquaticum]
MPGTITNAGLNATRDFLQSEVTELAVGTGTTDPTKTDTALENEVIRKPVDGDDAGTGEVTFATRLTSSEANGADLAELGAVDGDGDLQARLTYSSIVKTSDFEIEFRLTERAMNP